MYFIDQHADQAESLAAKMKRDRARFPIPALPDIDHLWNAAGSKTQEIVEKIRAEEFS